MSEYNTNLASEFYVLSMLHRKGFDATLTLGNKKSVDIVVLRKSGEYVTIDVKGLAGKTGWPANNVKDFPRRHFVVLVCFLGLLDDHCTLPEVYVVPASEFRKRKLIYQSPRSDRSVIQLSKMRQKGQDLQDAWELLR